MKTEHEKLKNICDRIGYNFNVSLDNFVDFNNNIITVREIIFTPEFKTKFEEYYYGKKEGELYGFDEVLNHLDNPVEFLFDLLGLGKQ